MLKNQTSPFSNSDYKSDPYPLYALMRSQSPAYLTILPGNAEVYMVTRYEDVQAALKDERLVKDIKNARPQGTLNRNPGKKKYAKG